jgi:hypothetical protein
MTGPRATPGTTGVPVRTIGPARGSVAAGEVPVEEAPVEVVPVEVLPVVVDMCGLEVRRAAHAIALGVA